MVGRGDARSRVGRRVAAYAVAGAVAVTYLAMLGPVVTAAQAATVTFASTGTEQVFGVPAGVRSVHVVAVGGRGGNTFTSGGFGAVAIADLAVTPGQTLYVEVAGNGQDRASGAGFNGGGAGGPEPYGVDGAGGGGASDVRTLTASDPDSLWSRLIVAGGGGGGSAWGTGGAAGQPGAGILNLPFGGTTLVGGGPGTATAGGAGGQAWYSPPGEGGRLGQGGTGAAWGSSGGGGGGGGLYGGGGGAGELQTCGNTCTSLGPGGGGGGSSGFDTTATNGSVGNDQTGVATVAIGYTEPPPPSTLTVSRARAQAGGAITVTANVSSAGRLERCRVDQGEAAGFTTTHLPLRHRIGHGRHVPYHRPTHPAHEAGQATACTPPAVDGVRRRHLHPGGRRHPQDQDRECRGPRRRPHPLTKPDVPAQARSRIPAFLLALNQPRVVSVAGSSARPSPLARKCACVSVHDDIFPANRHYPEARSYSYSWIRF